MDRVRRAWGRLLDPESDAVRNPTAVPVEGRLDVLREGSGVLTVVRLGDGVAVCGPAQAVELTHGSDPEQLGDHAVLLGLVAGLGARPLGAADLFYAVAGRSATGPSARGSSLAPGPAGLTLVSDGDRRLAAALEAECDQADVDEVGLGDYPSRWILCEGRDHRGREDGSDVPVAGAGYLVWADELAHVGVLTRPDRRGSGLGAVVSAAAVGDALARGLVPQWRARPDNVTSTALARRLGLVRTGSQTTVLLA